MMPTLAEIQEMRSVALASMLDSCTIMAATETSVKGSVTTTFTQAAANVPCRIAPPRQSGRPEGNTNVSGEKVSVIYDYILIVPWDQAIATGNQVICNNVTYEVGPVHDQGALHVANRATIRKIN